MEVSLALYCINPFPVHPVSVPLFIPPYLELIFKAPPCTSASISMPSKVSTRRRIGIACAYCRYRKIRCCGSDICANCIRANRKCVYVPANESDQFEKGVRIGEEPPFKTHRKTLTRGVSKCTSKTPKRAGGSRKAYDGSCRTSPHLVAKNSDKRDSFSTVETPSPSPSAPSSMTNSDSTPSGSPSSSRGSTRRSRSSVGNVYGKSDEVLPSLSDPIFGLSQNPPSRHAKSSYFPLFSANGAPLPSITGFLLPSEPNHFPLPNQAVYEQSESTEDTDSSYPFGTHSSNSDESISSECTSLESFVYKSFYPGERRHGYKRRSSPTAPSPFHNLTEDETLCASVSDTTRDSFKLYSGRLVPSPGSILQNAYKYLSQPSQDQLGYVDLPVPAGYDYETFSFVTTPSGAYADGYQSSPSQFAAACGFNQLRNIPFQTPSEGDITSHQSGFVSSLANALGTFPSTTCSFQESSQNISVAMPNLISSGSVGCLRITPPSVRLIDPAFVYAAGYSNGGGSPQGSLYGHVRSNQTNDFRLESNAWDLQFTESVYRNVFLYT
ncbi:Zn(2)-C6 fungal-type DNA-binding domain [Phaffia rhodozyma]|uniref:Zn(2)-C6 fungal-type DNA-binding domain n=1 Tax=Phaffia rhodozyma TaxID=264483 RepID=A0A0F7SSU0_PHARH|nr:Zn(2)-C6 fungal-type DNA-binding domain [Phaffia rhodozyma]